MERKTQDTTPAAETTQERWPLHTVVVGEYIIVVCTDGFVWRRDLTVMLGDNHAIPGTPAARATGGSDE